MSSSHYIRAQRRREALHFLALLFGAVVMVGLMTFASGAYLYWTLK